MNSSQFPLSLYHGTSTLFLPDILSLGLAAKNPLAELQVHELAQELAPLIRQHLSHTDMYAHRHDTWERMVNQWSGAMNFQHGQTYLSPSISTAVRYAINNRCGSEFLTYAVDFLGLFIARDVPGVRDRLFRKFPNVFQLLDRSPAPVLLRVDDVPTGSLLAEDGGPPDKNIEFVLQMLTEMPDLVQGILQQTNFRLCAPASLVQLRAWLIAVSHWHVVGSEFKLYELSLQSEQSAV